MKSNLLGYAVATRDLPQLITTVLGWCESGDTHRYMACANPHSLVEASKDSLFREALESADMLIPDGAGVVYAGKLLNLPIKARVAGFDFFFALNEAAEKNGGMKYFFLGSSTAVLERICKRLRADFPLIEICGCYSPPYKDQFDDHDNQVMVDLINKAHPDVVWVGMTAPKQEKWIYQNRKELLVPFSAAIGAVFDFYAGTVKRPSKLWQKLGLEWLPRFIKEPRRLWRRNLVSTPLFLYWVAMEVLSKRGGRQKSS